VAERETSIRRGVEALLTLASDEAAAEGGLGVTRVARMLGREKTQVSRTLATLAEYGLVDRDPDTRAYRLGWRIYAMAQTAGSLVMHSLNQPVGSVVYFMTIEQARFRKPVAPGHLLRMPVKKVRQRGPVWKFSGQAFVGEDLCAEAEFGAMISDGASAGSGG